MCVCDGDRRDGQKQKVMGVSGRTVSVLLWANSGLVSETKYMYRFLAPIQLLHLSLAVLCLCVSCVCACERERACVHG